MIDSGEGRNLVLLIVRRGWTLGNLQWGEEGPRVNDSEEEKGVTWDDGQWKGEVLSVIDSEWKGT